MGTGAKMKRPWLKFYPADWRSDPRLRMCSLAARGLWIDLISYMHEGEPYGHLGLYGIHPTIAEISGLVGRPEREVAAAFSELVAKGVCDQSDDGAIVSRRMVRDKAKDERDQANGKGGGNPELIGRVNQHDKPKSNGEDKAQKLEARIPEKKEATGSEVEPVRSKLKYPAAFQGWWLAYPTTPVMSKKEANAAWNRLSEPDRLAAITALPKYREWLKSKPDHPVVHACRFLSQRRFDGFEEAPHSAAEATPTGFYAADGTPELDAWDAHYRATKGINAPRDHHFGWRFATQWPPGYEAKNWNGSASAAATEGMKP